MQACLLGRASGQGIPHRRSTAGEPLGPLVVEPEGGTEGVGARAYYPITRSDFSAKYSDPIIC